MPLIFVDSGEYSDYRVHGTFMTDLTRDMVIMGIREYLIEKGANPNRYSSDEATFGAISARLSAKHNVPVEWIPFAHPISLDYDLETEEEKRQKAIEWARDREFRYMNDQFMQMFKRDDPLPWDVMGKGTFVHSMRLKDQWVPKVGEIVAWLAWNRDDGFFHPEGTPYYRGEVKTVRNLTLVIAVGGSDFSTEIMNPWLFPVSIYDPDKRKNE